MRLLKISSTSIYRQRCDVCNRAIREGQIALVQGRRDWRSVSTQAHRACIEQLLEQGPFEDEQLYRADEKGRLVRKTKTELLEEQFEELRQRLIEEHTVKVKSKRGTRK